jgi:hypothetical protein
MLMARARLLSLLAGAGVLASLATPARAVGPQPWPSMSATPPTVAVYDIPRPSYDPTGLLLGSFLFFPLIEQKASYDDNIFASDVHTAADYVNLTREAMSFQSQWSRHSLSGQFFTSQQIFKAHPSEDANSYFGNLSGRLDIANDAFVQLDLTGSQQPQSRAAAVAVTSGFSRPVFNDWQSAVSYEQRFGRWSELAQGSVEKVVYITPEAFGFSFFEPLFRNRLIYAISDRLGVFAEASFRMREWKLQPDLRNYNQLTGLIGFTYVVPTLIDAELGVGAARQAYDNAAFSTLYSPVVNGSVTWNVLPLTSLLANAYRTVAGTEFFCTPGAATCQTASGVAALPGTTRLGTRDAHTQTFGSLGVQHEIYHNLLGEAAFSYAHDAFDFDDLTDNTYSPSGNLRYLVNQHFELDLDYAYRIRTSNQPNNRLFNSGPYRENVVTLTLKAGL